MGGRLPNARGPRIGWSLQPTGLQRILRAIELPTNNAKYTLYPILIMIRKTNRGGSRQYITVHRGINLPAIVHLKPLAWSPRGLWAGLCGTGVFLPKYAVIMISGTLTSAWTTRRRGEVVCAVKLQQIQLEKSLKIVFFQRNLHFFCQKCKHVLLPVIKLKR